MPKASKKRSKRSKTAVVAANAYLPTKAEHAAIARLADRIEQAPPHALANVEVRDGSTHIGWNHESQIVAAALWAGALGTTDFMFAGTIFEQLAQLARKDSGIDEKEFNGMLALVRGLAPTDPTEALLVAQMAARHWPR